MSGLVVLIPLAVAMGLAALVAFLWALRSGQYEDLEGASQRIFEEDLPGGRALPPQAVDRDQRRPAIRLQ